MQFLVTLQIRPDADPAAIAAARAPSSAVLWKLYLGGLVRQMFARQDNAGVVFLAEAASPEDLAAGLAELPLLRDGLLVGEAIALAPFPDLALAFSQS